MGFLIGSFFFSFGIAHASTILDNVAGANNAYGLRLLKSSYTGPLVRIRRTDGGEADVSPDGSGNFSGTSPVTIISGGSGATTLSGFIASTNAFVEIWYDQVGSANVIQSTTSDQPQIVSSGSIITAGSNSEPAIQFNGTTTLLQSSANVVFSQPFTIFSFSAQTASSNARLFEIGNNPSSSNRAIFQIGNGMYSGSFASTTAQTTPYSVDKWTCFFNTTASQLWVNRAQYRIRKYGKQYGQRVCNIGGGFGGGLNVTGTISEFIILQHITFELESTRS